MLFGSVAKGTTHKQSDIDIAVIADPFKESRMDERVGIHLASMDVDPRAETVTPRPAGFRYPFSTLAREIERTGVGV